MLVKPSSLNKTMRGACATALLTSLTACGGNGIDTAEWWRQVNNEREPQMVMNNRRMPMLNAKVHAARGQAPQMQAAQQARPAIDAAQHYSDDAPASTSAYDNPRVQGQDEPYLLESIGSWLGVDAADKTSHLHADYHMASMPEEGRAQVMAATMQRRPINVKRKPIAGNPRAAYVQPKAAVNAVSAPAIAVHAGAQNMPADSALADMAPSAGASESPQGQPLRKKLIAQRVKAAESELDVDYTQAVELAETSVSSVPEAMSQPLMVLPWNLAALPTQPLSNTPINPQQLSAIAHGSGGRKESNHTAELTASSLFAEVGGHGIAPLEYEVYEHVTLASTITQVPAVSAELEAPAELSVLAPSASALPEPAGVPEASEVLAAEPQPKPSIEPAAVMAANEYPPLSSVPQVPERLEEVAEEHVEIKADLEDAKLDAEQRTQAVKQQVEDEKPESLMPLATQPKAPSTMPKAEPGALMLPPSQFDEEENHASLVNMDAPLAAIKLPEMVVAYANTAPTRASYANVSYVTSQQVAAQPSAVDADDMMDVALEAGYQLSKIQRQAGAMLSVIPMYSTLAVLSESRVTQYMPRY